MFAATANTASTAATGEQLARQAGYHRNTASTRGRTGGIILTAHLRDKCGLAVEGNGQKHVGFLMATAATEEVHPLAGAMARRLEPSRWRASSAPWAAGAAKFVSGCVAAGSAHWRGRNPPPADTRFDV